MRELELTQGLTALVDDCDFETASRYRWFAHESSSGLFYARGYLKGVPGRAYVYLHRVIMGCSASVVVDHIDGNPLNNVRANLRVATSAQNSANRGPNSNNSSGFKGVWASGERWRSRIMVNGCRVNLGYFDDAQDAARAYDKAARDLFGEFACLNFPSDQAS